jgi:Zn-dependent peptidase ImmA (M78 family)
MIFGNSLALKMITALEAPAPSMLSKSSVQQLAENISKQLGITPGCDLSEIVTRLGGVIEWRDVWDRSGTDSGSAEIRREGDFTIYLSTSTTEERDRFTLAHEIGHYILHYLWPLKQGKAIGALRVSRYGSTRVEWEANWFAASFLMPEADFRAAHAQFLGNTVAIADHFRVSTMAASIRAQSLNLPSSSNEPG